jgi:hypothetical protein
VVVFPENGSLTIFARRFDGEAWQPLGDTGQVVESGSADLTVAVDSAGQVLVAWAQYGAGGGIRLRRFDGLAWSDLGVAEPSFISPEGAEIPSLAIDGQDRPVLAWTQRDAYGQPGRAYLRRFDGASEVELGGSASGGGVSGSDDADSAAVAIAESGEPVVAWTSASSGFRQAYLRMFDGTDWVPLRGSASGGGVSNSEAASSNPSVAVLPGMICVAWEEMGEEHTEIVAGCAEP